MRCSSLPALSGPSSAQCNRASTLGCVTVCHTISPTGAPNRRPVGDPVLTVDQAPNKHIGGSGVLASVFCLLQIPSGHGEDDCYVWSVAWDSFLDTANRFVIPCALTLLLCLLLCLTHLWIIGWRACPTPLGRVCGYLVQRVPARCALCWRLSPSQEPLLDWRPHPKAKRARSRQCDTFGMHRGFFSSILCSCVWWQLPVLVWAAPKDLRVLQEVAEAVSLVGLSYSFQVPDELDAPPSVPRRTVPDFVDLSLQRPAGPPPPQPMCLTIDNAIQHTQPAQTVSAFSCMGCHSGAAADHVAVAHWHPM